MRASLARGATQSLTASCEHSILHLLMTWTRRNALTAGLYSLAPLPGRAQALPDRLSLDLGHRGSRGGPIATLEDGTMLWVCTEPEAPYLAREMWQISRLTMRRSHDGGH